MQYAYARLRSIAQSAERRTTTADSVTIVEPAERRLARRLLDHAAAVETVAAPRVHITCASICSISLVRSARFIPKCRSSKPNPGAGLTAQLLALVAETLKHGLSLLGIRSARADVANKLASDAKTALAGWNPRRRASSDDTHADRPMDCGESGTQKPLCSVTVEPQHRQRRHREHIRRKAHDAVGQHMRKRRKRLAFFDGSVIPSRSLPSRKSPACSISQHLRRCQRWRFPVRPKTSSIRRKTTRLRTEGSARHFSPSAQPAALWPGDSLLDCRRRRASQYVDKGQQADRSAQQTHRRPAPSATGFKSPGSLRGEAPRPGPAAAIQQVTNTAACPPPFPVAAKAKTSGLAPG